MSGQTPPQQFTNTLTVPMGFGAQIRALQETQREQMHRIAALERENTELKAFKKTTCPDLLARIEALEAHNAHLTARRKEAVAQLLSLRTLHQESANAFLVRAAGIEDDDLEGMLSVYGTSVTTVLNQHQRALGQMRIGGRIPAYGAGFPQGVPRGAAGYPFGHAYPPAFHQSAFCQAHQQPCPCRVCSQ